MATNVIKLVL